MLKASDLKVHVPLSGPVSTKPTVRQSRPVPPGESKVGGAAGRLTGRGHDLDHTQTNRRGVVAQPGPAWCLMTPDT